MASPTRDEFLSYVHAPLVNRDGDPKPGSPTKSTMRYRWHELRHWQVEVDAQSYWDATPDDDKTQTVDVPPAYWSVIEHQLRTFSQPLTSEPTLKVPFANALQIPHNTAIPGASDAHAEIWAEGSKLAIQPIGNADFIMVHDGKLTGIIELKTWWKVTTTEIEDVRTGPTHVVHCSNDSRPRTSGWNTPWPSSHRTNIRLPRIRQ